MHHATAKREVQRHKSLVANLLKRARSKGTLTPENIRQLEYVLEESAKSANEVFKHIQVV